MFFTPIYASWMIALGDSTCHLLVNFIYFTLTHKNQIDDGFPPSQADRKNAAGLAIEWPTTLHHRRLCIGAKKYWGRKMQKLRCKAYHLTHRVAPAVFIVLFLRHLLKHVSKIFWFVFQRFAKKKKKIMQWYIRHIFSFYDDEGGLFGVDVR